MGKIKCYLCNSILNDDAVEYHLQSCIKNKYKSTENESNKVTFLLKVQTKKNTGHCLYLLTDGCVTFLQLEKYIKDIWLTNKKTTSYFIIDDYSFETKRDKSAPLEACLYQISQFEYITDKNLTFTIDVANVYGSLFDKKGIRPVARNIPKGKISFNSPLCDVNKPQKDILFMPYKDNTESVEQKIDFSKSSVKDMDTKEKKRILKLMGLDPNNQELLDNLFSEEENTEEEDKPLSLYDYILEPNTLPDNTLLSYLSSLNQKELQGIKESYGLYDTNKESIDLLHKYIKEYIKIILYSLRPRDVDMLYNISKENKEKGEQLKYSTASYKDYNNNINIPVFLQYMTKKGLLTITDNPEDKNISLNVPNLVADAILDIKSKSNNSEVKLMQKIENTIILILFYRGIVTKEHLINQTAKLTKQELSEDFKVRFNIKFNFLCVNTVKATRISNETYYSMFIRNPKKQVHKIVQSDIWKNSEYVDINNKYSVVNRKDFYKNIYLTNPHYSNLYQASIKSMKENDTDEYQAEQMALSSIRSFFTAIAVLKPDTKTKELMEKLQIPKYMQANRGFRDVISGLLESTPRYYLKGNIENNGTHLKKQTGMSVAQKAAAKWNLKDNDPCPCGSGKPYKECCKK